MNYKHLKYFVAVAQEGSISKAADKLHLAPQTVSHQLGLLEESLNTRLLERVGTRWVLTDAGTAALSYAEEIFALGKELKDVLSGGDTDKPLGFYVGITDAIPKSVAYKLISPALSLSRPIELHCIEGSFSSLLDNLSEHKLDMILSPKPLMSQVSGKLESHLLKQSRVSFMAHEKFVSEVPFPECLNDMPFLLPSDHHSLAHDLQAWFTDKGLSPKICARFDDSALLKAFARGGVGACCIPNFIEEDVVREFGLEKLGETDEVNERYFGIHTRRRVPHPAVAAICCSSNRDKV